MEYPPTPVAARSKTWVCGLSFAGIVGSNPTGGVETCLLLSGRGFSDGLITRPEECYRMWRVWVWSRSLNNEED